MVTTFDDIESVQRVLSERPYESRSPADKLSFYAAFLEHVDRARARGIPVIFCGDVNTAHLPIDLSTLKGEREISAPGRRKRVCMDVWEEHGWITASAIFTLMRPRPSSWWSMRTNA